MTAAATALIVVVVMLCACLLLIAIWAFFSGDTASGMVEEDPPTLNTRGDD